VKARAVRHRQALGDDRIALDINDQSAILAMIPPAVDLVGTGGGADIFGFSVDHRQTVEMAAILRDNLADEIGFPDRLETVGQAGFAQAIEASVDEDNPASVLNSDLVDIDIAGGLQIAWDIHLVMHLIGGLIRAEHILHPHDLGQRAQIDPAGIAGQAHRLRIDRFM